jgi:hypothetical protein
VGTIFGRGEGNRNRNRLAWVPEIEMTENRLGDYPICGEDAGKAKDILRKA